MALVTQRNQRVGDLVAGTFVVDKNFAGAIADGQPAADWYPDPQGQARLRYWDGQRWTDHTSA